MPVLGICYGAQLLAQQGGGEVLPATIREYGRARLTSLDTRPRRCCAACTWIRRYGCRTATRLRRCRLTITIIAGTPEVAVAAYKLPGQETYGIQFHPEVTHSTEGQAAAQKLCGRYLRLRPKLDARPLRGFDGGGPAKHYRPRLTR